MTGRAGTARAASDGMAKIDRKWVSVAPGLLLAFACGNVELGFPGFGGQGGTAPQSITILIPANAESLNTKGFGDNPKQVVQGSTVTWTNEDTVPQTITAVNGEFDSGQLAPGASFSQTFSNVAVIPYYSTLHPALSGTINVIAAVAPPIPQASPSPTSPTPTPVVSPVVAPTPFVTAPPLSSVTG
jgi:hypothetical protein